MPKSDYVLYIWRWKNSIHSVKTRSGADCISDYELLIAKFKLNLRKVGKTTMSFKYDLNHIPYDYTVEVTNRFKELDLAEYMKNYRQRFVALYRRQWPKPSPKKKCKKAKWLSKKDLQMAEKRSKRQRRKGKISPIECRVPENRKER